MYNKAILVGRITADPELKTTPKGVSVCSFTVACDRRFTDKDGNRDTDFIDVVAWRNAAEFASKFFTKGKAIGVDGSIQTRKYTDKNGNNRVAFEVVADNCFFVGDKGSKPSVDVEDYEPLDDSDDAPF